MPEPLDFEQIRWKLADDLTTDEADLIIANQDKLNDEEKAAFSDLILQTTPLSDNPLDTVIDETVDNQDDNSKPPIDNKPSQEAQAPTPPQLPDNVVTQDKLDSYIEEKRRAWEAEGKTKEEQKEEEQQIKLTVFKEGELPADWNDAINKFAPALLDAAEKRIIDRLQRQNQEFADQQAKMKATEKEIYERFEGEFQTLAKNKLIPDPKVDPEGYKKVHEAILDLGGKHGKATVTDAYELWRIIPEVHGGGLKADENPAQKKIDAQKAAAAKIGSARGTAAPQKRGTPAWADIHSNSMDDLLEKRLQQP